MYAAAIRVELRIPNVQSLKAKRAVVRSVVAQIGQQLGLAVAEVDHHDLWQRSTLGVAAVSGQAGHLDRVIHSLERDLERRTDIEVLGVITSYLEDLV